MPARRPSSSTRSTSPSFASGGSAPPRAVPTDPADKFGDVFLVIDNFGDLYEKDFVMGDRAISIARQGLSYGIHVVTSSIGWLIGQKQALLNVSNARIELRLSNPDESQMGSGIDHRRAARRVLDTPGIRPDADEPRDVDGRTGDRRTQR